MRQFLFISAALAGFVTFGSPRTWDFTKGVPSDGRLRSSAAVDARGLVSTNSADIVKPGGFALKEKFVYPESFRFEAQVEFRSNGNKSHSGVLWDDMYITYRHPHQTHAGLQVAFSRWQDMIRPVVYVGVAGETCRVSGPGVKVKDGDLLDFRFGYSANRMITLELNGERLTSCIAKAGPVAPSTRTPVIGDRIGSNYSKLEGAVRRVSVVPLGRACLAAVVEGRTAFERGEEGARMHFGVECPVFDVRDVHAEIRQLDADGRMVGKTEREMGVLARGSSTKLTVPVETRLKPGSVSFVITLTGTTDAGTVVKASHACPAAIGPAFATRMTTLMWGHRAPFSVVADYGFTHGITGAGCTGPRTPDMDEAAIVRPYDQALAAGFKLTRHVGVRYPEGRKEEAYYRLDRKGSRRVGRSTKPVPEVSHPDMIDWARKGAVADTEVLQDHPAFCGTLAVSERRDQTFPSFNTEQERYRRETGCEVPPEVERKVAPPAYAKGRFPDGVVPDDDPVLRYYRWFWNGGDGWPAYLSAIAEGYRQRYGSFEDGSAPQSRRPFFSFHDPAVRCPPVWGSGGSVDCLNQWCYANPEPMNVAGPIEEMFAMAAGRPGQQVMAMTQLICYRAQLAPKDVMVEPAPDWVTRRPEAAFPSIPPDSLQEATWSMIAKPVRGIMFHGWGCIYETGEAKGYVYTNGETAERLRYLLKDVVAPLGPSLLKIGREKSPVAVLESGTTALLGGPASWGWTAPAVTFFQRARLDPRVVYEEAVERGALADGSVKVLYAPQLIYSTRPVIERIRAFQRRGGILVGDEQTLKALTPDIVAPLVSFIAPPASDHTEDVDAQEAAKGVDLKSRSATVNAKRIMVRQAEDIRAALARKGYVPSADSSSPEIVVYRRRRGTTPYLFAINDRRTFGDYVGQWGRTMEKGLPFSGQVTLAYEGCGVGAVYELSRGVKMPFTCSGETVAVPLDFTTNDGRLLVFLPEEIAELKVDAPAAVEAGGTIDVRLKVLGRSGAPVPAVLPVEVRLYDAAGVELDGAGFAAAEDGVCTMRIRTNVNDPSGPYRLVCRDRSSGLTAERMVGSAR